MSKLSPEQRFLFKEAQKIWHDLKVAKTAKLPWQEETITDILIRNVKLRYPGQVEVIPFNKILEGESGADWIWSFVNAAGTQSITMLVQAKKLDEQEVRYPEIDRTIGKRVPPVRQIDQLIATAAQFGLGAFYAFYNHLSDIGRVNFHCQSLSPKHPRYRHGFGISIAEAELVRAALPDQHYDTHCQHSIALHCLLCSQGQGAYPGGGTPVAIVGSLLEQRRRRLAQSERGGPPDAPPRGSFSTDLPSPEMLGFRGEGEHPIVERARRGATGLEKGVPPGEFELPDAAGLVVLRDADRRETPAFDPISPRRRP